MYGKVKNKLGFIIEKDSYYDDYYVDLIFAKKDWFEEKDIKRVFGIKKNKVEKYQVRLCTTNVGYQMIKENLKKNEPIPNNKLKKVTMYKEFSKNNKKYIALIWKSVFWPVSNRSVEIIEDTVGKFRSLNIPFQYIVMNEENLNDTEVKEFITNDSNVNVFSIERKIKFKILNKPYKRNGRKDKK